MTRSLDHFVLAVHDLEAGAAIYRRLGFLVRPPARHLEIGSSNCVMHFPRTYLELLSPGESREAIEPAYRELLQPYFDRLAIGEGLAHVSLDSPDLEADQRRMQEVGFVPGPIMSARRRITRPDGSADETDSHCFYLWRDDNRFLSLFLSEHRKPEAIFIPQYEDHPNTAAEVARVVYVSRDPQGDLEYFAKLFGKKADDVAYDAFHFVGARGDLTEVLTLEAARVRYGENVPQQELADSAGVGIAMHYSSRDLRRCAGWLDRAGVRFEKAGDRVIVPASEACGCTTVFEG